MVRARPNKPIRRNAEYEVGLILWAADSESRFVSVVVWNEASSPLEKLASELLLRSPLWSDGVGIWSTVTSYIILFVLALFRIIMKDRPTTTAATPSNRARNFLLRPNHRNSRAYRSSSPVFRRREYGRFFVDERNVLC